MIILRQNLHLTLEISSAMEQYEIDNTAITASEKRLDQIDKRTPQIKIELKRLMMLDKI